MDALDSHRPEDRRAPGLSGALPPPVVLVTVKIAVRRRDRLGARARPGRSLPPPSLLSESGSGSVKDPVVALQWFTGL